MKKALLFGLMLLGASTAYGDSALNGDLSFNLETYDSKSGTITVGTQIDNTKNGASVIYCFTSPAEAGQYNVKAVWGGKYDATITMNISADSGNFDSKTKVSRSLTGSGSKYDASITETWGQFDLTENTIYYLQISFATSESYAGNIYSIVLEKYNASATRYTLTTSVTPVDWGTVKGNNDENYVEGSTVSLTATPNAGYRFKQWNISNVDGVSTDNPVNVTMDADVTAQAVFEEIPNALQSDLSFNIADYYSTSGTVTVDTASDPATIGSSKNGSSVIYRFTSPAEGTYNIKAIWVGKYDATITMNVSTDPADFDAEKAIAVALPGTGDWTTTKEATWSKFELAAATTYYLQISFATSEAWAGNITYLALEADQIALTDAINFDLPFDVNATSATYTRNVVADTWNALYLPFAVTNASEFASKVVAFTGVVAEGEDVALEFDNVDLSTTLDANTIYLFQPKDDVSTITAKGTKVYAAPTVNAAVSKSDGSYTCTLTGTYEKMTGLKTKGVYALAGDCFKKAKTDEVELNPYRAYLTVSTTSPAPARISIRTSEDTSAISVINIENAPAADVYYNLQGMRVDNPTKGLYIHNGKKVYLK